MTSPKVALTKEKATLLFTLFAKAEESRMPGSLLHDTAAAEAVAHITYDFSRFHLNQETMVALAIRAKIMDSWTAEFLARTPSATILHLGCGLDTRVFRLDPPASVQWFDVDFPEVIELRRALYPPREGYTLLGSSVLEHDWLYAVPQDQPAMIVAEGLMPYLPEDDVPRLLNRLVRYFPEGEIAFDAYSRLGLALLRLDPTIRETGAALFWSLEDPHELETQVPGLKLIGDVTSYDPADLARMPWISLMKIFFLQTVPVLRQLGRLLRYRF